MGAEAPSNLTHKAVVALLPGAGRYLARIAVTAADVAATQALRHLCFVEAPGWPPRAGGLEIDGYDALCRHVMIEEVAGGRLVCSFRIMDLRNGADIGRSYAAQFYDLGRLAGYALPMVEIGRFCIHPEVRDADVLRLAWGALARIVDGQGVGMLFGCSSFAGTDPAPYAGVFALLSAVHVAPDTVAPGVKAAEVVRFGAGGTIDRLRALTAMPPLLRTYLGMGGWVSDHAVIDRDLGTLHVFTGVEIGAIPPGRARALRAVAG